MRSKTILLVLAAFAAPTAAHAQEAPAQGGQAGQAQGMPAGHPSGSIEELRRRLEEERAQIRAREGQQGPVQQGQVQQGQLPSGHPPMPAGQGQQAPQGQAPQGQLPAGHPPTPTGPGQAIQQIQQQQQQAQQAQQMQGMTAEQQQMHSIMQGQGPQVASAGPSPNVPPGTIRVTVSEPGGQLVEGQLVELGILSQGGEGRDKVHGRTNAEGVYEWTEQPTGQTQAYRVNVLHSGAKYSSEPFQLPPDQGYDVKITRLPTTRDLNAVIMVSGNFIEVRDKRLHVIQEARIINADPRGLTLVLPQEGVFAPLPEGAKAFSAQDVMTDQRVEYVEETDDEPHGIRFFGSIPPGEARVRWAFDIDIDGTTMDFALPVPFRAAAVQVRADAPEGLEMDVEGAPRPTLERMGGHRMLSTQIRRQPQDPQIERVSIRLSNIPGRGPWPWIAIGAALVFLAGSLMFMFRGGDPAETAAAERKRRKQELLDQAEELERMFEENEIGPKYRARQMDAIVAELAILLRQEKAAEAAAKGTSTRKKAGDKRA